jgi:hypothetical protein
MLPEQLAMVATSALQHELMSRYDHAIFFGYKERPLAHDPHNHVKYRARVRHDDDVPT